MKRILLLVMLVFVGFSMVEAQSMSDDQVIEYVMDAQAKGVPQSQMVKDLMRKGVTMDQVKRLKQRANAKERVGQGNSIGDKKRVRTAPKNGSAVEFESDRIAVRNMKDEEKEGYMEDEMSFLFPDSLDMMMMKPVKEIFGHNIFQNKEVMLEASYNLPTPTNYPLGPGDEVSIDIWGASQSNIQDVISPDGNIYVENLGPVHLSGLTVAEANEYLKEEFGKIYSGINADDPNSNIRLSLAQNRTIQVHVMGEVENPGTYAMSSFSTVFNALYQAGGVNEVGTMRAVKVYRDDKPIESYDIYDFILNGNANKGIRLEDNDVVVVDAYQQLVCITGKVKRPMYYEMLETESAATLLKYAGGFAGNAYKEDIRLTRNGKREREIYTLNAAQQSAFMLIDGDSVSVDSIMNTYSNRVEVRGAVYRPGEFQMDGAVTTVRQLIELAGGLKDDAFMARAILNRRNANNTLDNMAIDLEKLLAGEVEDVKLRKNDILLIPSIFDMQEQQVISIYGEIAFPGTYQYMDNMTVEDFIVQAGGLKEAASTAKVDVARRMKDSRATSANDTISQTFTFSISDGLVVGGAESFTLKPFDEVYVRKSPGYFSQENVMVEGEVLFEGTYALTKKNQRLSELVANAGGLTNEANPRGARLLREMTTEEKDRLTTTLEAQLTDAKTSKDSLRIRSKMLQMMVYPVGIELDQALEKPGSDADITLREGDKLIIPQFSNTVKLTGEVMYANTIAFRKGKKLNYYINQAGGYSNKAKKSKVYIIYPNGTVTKANKWSSKVVQPGCEIVVPQKDDSHRMSPGEILSLSSTSASLATVILTLVNLFK